MAMLNIPSHREDPNYRYKMPRLMSKVEGRGNGIKTNIMNMAEIARSLKRPPEYPTKFCGHELGASAKFETSEGKAIVNGAHEARDLQTLIDKFIEKYVLCPSCSLPEIDIMIQKKTGIVACKCNACGYSGDLDNSHKLATFMVRNPPDGSTSTLKSAPIKKGKSKAERKEQKLLKANNAPNVDGSTLPLPNTTLSGESSPSAADKKLEKKKARKVEAAAESGVSDDGATKKKKKKHTKKEGVKAILEKEKLSYDSAEIADVIERMRRLLENTDDNGPTAFFTELRVLQVSQDFDSVIRLFVTLEIFFGCETPLDSDILESKLPYLMKVIDTSMSTSKVCSALEDYIELRNPKSIVNYGRILHKLFMEDCLDEKGLITRYSDKDTRKKLTSAYEKAFDEAAQFIEWLKEEASDSEDDVENDPVGDRHTVVVPPVNNTNIKDEQLGSSTVDNTTLDSMPMGDVVQQAANIVETPPPIITTSKAADVLQDIDEFNIDDI